MLSTQSVSRRLTAVTFFAIFAGTAAVGHAQAAAAPAAQAAPQPVLICGNTAFCYETADFAATITDFRTSVQGPYKIIDATVHFVNKTTGLVTLGYAVNSGTATDERGNRYIVAGANAYRGIGLVYGPNNFDPKFAIQPGGFGDARFELGLVGNPPVIGFNFELDLTVDEINTYTGNQHTLGGEFPLQFKGLANGAAGAQPGQVAMASNGTLASATGVANAATAPQPCGTAGTASAIAGATNSQTVQNATTGATTAVNNASAAVTSIGNLFGKKKAAPTNAVAGAATAPAPCTSTNAASATPATPAAAPAQTTKAQAKAATTTPAKP